MDMFNVFKQPSDTFNDMLNINGQEIYHNGKRKYAIITNPDIKEFNDKYISTNFAMVRGDYIYYDDRYWMIWNQVNVARVESYKGIMRQAEHDIVFNLYYAGVTSKYLLKVPAVIQRTSDYTYRTDSIITTVDSEIHVFIQDTPSTRRIIGLVNNQDGQIILGQRNYDIIGISFEKKGYLNITCKMGLNNAYSDYENNIYWRTNDKPEDWQNQFDLSFYQREGVKPSVPNDYQTSINLTLTSTDYTSTSKGTITATWTEEANKDVYTDFTGYKVVLLQGSNEIEIITTDKLSYTFNNLEVGSYTVEVYSIFENNNTIKPVTSTVNVADGDMPVPSPSDGTTNVTLIAYDDSTTNGTLVWTPEENKSIYTGYTFVGYRVEVWTSSLFAGDKMQNYWVTSTEQQSIGTGWAGELGWFVRIYSRFTKDGVTYQMQPKQFDGNSIVALPNNPQLW